MSVWKPHTQVPANVLHLIEYRLQEIGHSVTGFVLLVPHYLSDTEYPDVAVKALESISAATGLIFATEPLRVEGREFTQKIDSQVESNQELARLVGALEERHDSYMAGNPLRSPLTDEDGELPTADEIAAELEKFLASGAAATTTRARSDLRLDSAERTSDVNSARSWLMWGVGTFRLRDRCPAADIARRRRGAGRRHGSTSPRRCSPAWSCSRSSCTPVCRSPSACCSTASDRSSSSPPERCS